MRVMVPIRAQQAEPRHRTLGQAQGAGDPVPYRQPRAVVAALLGFGAAVVELVLGGADE